jgi:hypothetical protein
LAHSCAQLRRSSEEYRRTTGGSAENQEDDPNTPEDETVTSGYTIEGETVTFDINDPGDVLECTYTNQARGSIVVNKVTTEGTGTFDFTSNSLGGGTPGTPHTFPLTTTAANTPVSQSFPDLAPGNYDVAETDPSPAGFNLVSATCDSDLTEEDDAIDPASITLGAGETVTCTFTNSTQEGALKILKQSTKTGNPLVSPVEGGTGARFDYTGDEVPDVTDNGTGDEDPDYGEVCVSGLDLGDYTVNETDPPTGYGPADASEGNQGVTVVGNTDCGDNPPGEGATATFTNPPLADIQVRFRDGGSGETQLTPNETIECDNPTGTDDTTDTTGWDDTLQVNGIEAGATEVTVTCTIPIDP